MIQALASNGPDEPFDVGPLPGGARRRQYWFDPHGLHLLDKLLPEDPVPIAQQIAGRRIPRKGFANLLRRPLRRGMCRYAEMDDASALVRQDQKNVQDLKPNGGYRKEIDRDHVLHMVVQKRSPGLRTRSSRSHHVLGDAGFADLDSEFQQLAVNTWRAPAWVIAAHHADQVTNFSRHRRPPRLAVSNLPPPPETKPPTMPRDHGLGLDDHQSRFPVGPHAAQPNPEEAVGRRQLQTFRRRAT